jgi:hypothetical protein
MIPSIPRLIFIPDELTMCKTGEEGQRQSTSVCGNVSELYL